MNNDISLEEIRKLYQEKAIAAVIEAKKPLIDSVFNASADLGAPRDLMLSKTRKKEVITCKYVCMAYLRFNSGMSLRELSRVFNLADHTCIIHGIRKYRDRITTNDEDTLAVDKYIKERVKLG